MSTEFKQLKYGPCYAVKALIARHREKELNEFQLLTVILLFVPWLFQRLDHLVEKRFSSNHMLFPIMLQNNCSFQIQPTSHKQ